jgi:arginase family enzyme
MSVREAIAHLHAIEGEIVGADLVEFNPVQDVGGITATVAAKILKEILGIMISRGQGLTTEDMGAHRG